MTDGNERGVEGSYLLPPDKPSLIIKNERILEADLREPLAANYLQAAYVNPMSGALSLTLARLLDSLIMVFLTAGIDLFPTPPPHQQA